MGNITINRQGVYTGPSKITKPNLDAFRVPEAHSLKGLVEVVGDLNLMNTSVTRIDDLELVSGFINLNRTEVHQMPKLREVNTLYTGLAVLPMLPVLEELKELWGRHTPIPYMPKVLDAEIKWVDREILGNDAKYDMYSYKELLDEVKETPAEELILLRTKKPILGHIIDARLRGEFVHE